MTADEILKKHEDENEYHLHEVDRAWFIEAMLEYAKQEAIKFSDFKSTYRRIEQINVRNDQIVNFGGEIYKMGAKAHSSALLWVG